MKRDTETRVAFDNLQDVGQKSLNITKFRREPHCSITVTIGGILFYTLYTAHQIRQLTNRAAITLISYVPLY